MPEDFSTLRDWIQNGHVPTEEETNGLSEAASRRLARAWRDRSTPVADFGPLVRHVLRGATERQNGNAQFLFVPSDKKLGAMWPEPVQWATWGVQTKSVGNSWRLRAEAWRPTWLEGAAGVSPEQAAFHGDVRREQKRVVGDPFLSCLGRDSYLSAGQKEGVRAILSAPPGSTLVVNLPTGSGKSLCAHILSCVPFADETAGNGVTVIVVPTTALAQDQERTLRKALNSAEDFAYYGGRDEATRERNRNIWKRLHDGSQKVLFTSPESLMLGLRPALYEAARRGYLRALVIDEAHIIEQWGDEFRSAFQEIAGLRRALLRESPHPKFRTLLLSATLTESSFGTLQTLFGEPGPFRMVSAVQLRPEPEWWIARCDNVAHQQTRVLESLRFLPRPLIVYTTQVPVAQAWENSLKQQGHKRLRVMTGKTHNRERDQIIGLWADGALDIVVATSAFGLGIDQSEVRAVLHACVPESLDRLYQEVGRGGRDGRASMSLMIYTHQQKWFDKKDDYRVASQMKNHNIIKAKKGFPRWQRMFDHKKRLNTPPHPRYEMPIDIAPGVDQRTIGMISEANEDWNARTLTLMARSGLIELDDEPPLKAETPIADADAVSEEEMVSERVMDEEVLQDVTSRRIVRIRDGQHLNRAHWEARIEESRRATARSRLRDWRLLNELLNGRRCAGDILLDAYSFLMSPTEDVPVARACGGCPHCRREGRAAYAELSSVSAWPWEPGTHVQQALQDYLNGSEILVVWLREVGQTEQAILSVRRKLLEWSVREGIRCVIAPTPILQALKSKEAALLRSRPVFFADEYNPFILPQVPTLLFPAPDELLDPNSSWLERAHCAVSSEVFDEKESPLIVVLPEGAPDPERPDRLLRDAVRCAAVRWDDLKARQSL